MAVAANGIQAAALFISVLTVHCGVPASIVPTLIPTPEMLFTCDVDAACDIFQTHGDDRNWIRAPSGRNSTDKFFQLVFRNTTAQANLITSVLAPNASAICLQFYCRSLGSSETSHAHITIKVTRGHNRSEPLNVVLCNSSSWEVHRVSIETRGLTDTFKVVLEGVAEGGGSGALGLDDISVYRGACLSPDFDSSSSENTKNSPPMPIPLTSAPRFLTTSEIVNSTVSTKAAATSTQDFRSSSSAATTGRTSSSQVSRSAPSVDVSVSTVIDQPAAVAATTNPYRDNQTSLQQTVTKSSVQEQTEGKADNSTQEAKVDNSPQENAHFSPNSFTGVAALATSTTPSTVLISQRPEINNGNINSTFVDSGELASPEPSFGIADVTSSYSPNTSSERNESVPDYRSVTNLLPLNETVSPSIFSLPTRNRTTGYITGGTFSLPTRNDEGWTVDPFSPSTSTTLKQKPEVNHVTDGIYPGLAAITLNSSSYSKTNVTVVGLYEKELWMIATAVLAGVLMLTLIVTGTVFYCWHRRLVSSSERNHPPLDDETVMTYEIKNSLHGGNNMAEDGAPFDFITQTYLCTERDWTNKSSQIFPDDTASKADDSDEDESEEEKKERSSSLSSDENVELEGSLYPKTHDSQWTSEGSQPLAKSQSPPSFVKSSLGETLRRTVTDNPPYSPTLNFATTAGSILKTTDPMSAYSNKPGGVGKLYMFPSRTSAASSSNTIISGTSLETNLLGNISRTASGTPLHREVADQKMYSQISSAQSVQIKLSSPQFPIKESESYPSLKVVRELGTEIPGSRVMKSATETLVRRDANEERYDSSKCNCARGDKKVSFENSALERIPIEEQDIDSVTKSKPIVDQYRRTAKNNRPPTEDDPTEKIKSRLVVGHDSKTAPKRRSMAEHNSDVIKNSRPTGEHDTKMASKCRPMAERNSEVIKNSKPNAGQDLNVALKKRPATEHDLEASKHNRPVESYDQHMDLNSRKITEHNRDASKHNIPVESHDQHMDLNSRKVTEYNRDTSKHNKSAESQDHYMELNSTKVPEHNLDDSKHNRSIESQDQYMELNSTKVTEHNLDDSKHNKSAESQDQYMDLNSRKVTEHNLDDSKHNRPIESQDQCMNLNSRKVTEHDLDSAKNSRLQAGQEHYAALNGEPEPEQSLHHTANTRTPLAYHDHDTGLTNRQLDKQVQNDTLELPVNSRHSTTLGESAGKRTGHPVKFLSPLNFVGLNKNSTKMDHNRPIRLQGREPSSSSNIASCKYKLPPVVLAHPSSAPPTHTRQQRRRDGLLFTPSSVSSTDKAPLSAFARSEQEPEVIQVPHRKSLGNAQRLGASTTYQFPSRTTSENPKSKGNNNPPRNGLTTNRTITFDDGNNLLQISDV